MLSALLFASLIGTLGDDPKLDGAFHIERSPLGKFEFTMTESLGEFAAQPPTWTVVAPMPPTYDAQTIHNAYLYIPSEAAKKAQRGKELSGLGQPILSAMFKTTDKLPVVAQAIYEVTLYKRTLAEGPSQEAPFPLGATRNSYTADAPWLDLGNTEFKDWMKEEQLLKAKDERDLKYAWRAFKHVAQMFSYDPEKLEDLAPLTTISNKQSNTFGLANLMVAILRANDIPARYVLGKPLAIIKERPYDFADRLLDEDTTECLVEFWAEGIGWVPADIVHAAGYHEPSEYFGNADGKFFACHFDLVQVEKGEWASLERLNWDKNLTGIALDEVKVKREMKVKKL